LFVPAVWLDLPKTKNHQKKRWAKKKMGSRDQKSTPKCPNASFVANKNNNVHVHEHVEGQDKM